MAATASKPSETSTPSEPKAAKLSTKPPASGTVLTSVDVKELRRPFSPVAVQWKIQDQPVGPSGSARVVPHIDARDVFERLFAVVGTNWDNAHHALPNGGMLCRLRVKHLTREDVGYASGSPDMAIKGAVSDSIKRAAVLFGIGASLYAVPRVWVPASDLVRVAQDRWWLPEHMHDMLAGQYEDWVKLPTTEGRFGTVYDHGETTEVIGNPQQPDEWHNPLWPSPQHAEAEVRFSGIVHAAAQQRNATPQSVGDPVMRAVGVELRGAETLRYATPRQLSEAADMLSASLATAG